MSPKMVSNFAVFGEWLAQTVDQCTCYGGEFGHEPGCGYEPVMKIAELRELLAANGLALVRPPSIAFKGPHDTDASMLRVAADKAESARYPVGGSNVGRAVADILRQVAMASSTQKERP